MFTIDKNPSAGKLRQFAVLLMVVPGVWAAVKWPLVSAHEGLGIALACVVALGAAGAVRPLILRRPFVLVSFLTFPLGVVLGYVLLGAIFFLILTPMAVVMRALSRDVVFAKPASGSSSYWLPTAQATRSSDYYLRP